MMIRLPWDFGKIISFKLSYRSKRGNLGTQDGCAQGALKKCILKKFVAI